MEDIYAGALLRERAAHQQNGRPDRVADVEAELARVGVDAAGVEAVIRLLAGQPALETAQAPAAPERATRRRAHKAS